MDDDLGFVALYRKFRSHQFWKERRRFSKAEAWLDLLMEVRWRDSVDRVLIGLHSIECGYGQSINSQVTWAKRWGWSEAAVRRFFLLLQNEKMIERENVGNTTRITVCNYGIYQKARRTKDEPATNPRRTRDEPATTEEQEDLNEVTRGTRSNPPPPPFTPPEWIDSESWALFVDHRKEIKKPMTPKAMKLTIEQLQAFENQGMSHVAVLKRSIRNGWQGVFALKDTNGSAPRKLSGIVSEATERSMQNAQRVLQRLEEEKNAGQATVS